MAASPIVETPVKNGLLGVAQVRIPCLGIPSGSSRPYSWAASLLV
jgi:hypothetical protein